MDHDQSRSQGFGRAMSWATARLASGAAALVLALAWTVPTAVSAQEATATPPPLVFDGVTVIDVEHGKLLPAQRVVIAGNRIQAVGEASAVEVPKSAQVVDARGKYLIPGLWDMHVHPPAPGKKSWTADPVTGGLIEHPPGSLATFYASFIAYGVTGIREMGQYYENGSDSFRVWQREIAAGARVGPRGIGPSIDLTHPIAQGPGKVIVATPDEARKVIDSAKAAGMAFVKLHDNLMPADIYFALMREARRVGMPVVGHTPDVATTVEIADSGQRSIEHIHYITNNCRDAGSPEARQQCAATAAALVRNDTWITPTVFRSTEGEGATAEQLKPLATLRSLGAMTFLAGADDGSGSTGFSLLQEVVFLTAVLTPLEALQAATLNPAKFLKATDSLGTVAPGKLADLVVLDADPLADIRNVMQTWAVVANGRYFDRAALDALNPERAERVKNYTTQSPSP